MFNLERPVLTNEEIIKYKNFEQNLVNIFGNGKVYGIDEVDVCNWAGNTAYCCVSIDNNKLYSKLIRDSKQLTKEQINLAYKELVNDGKIIDVGIGFATVNDYDTLGTRLAHEKGRRTAFQNLRETPTVILCDYYHIARVEGLQFATKRGDEKFRVVSAASIIAKYIRNKICEEIHKDFPEYKFSSNHGGFNKATKNLIIENGFIPGWCRKGWCRKFTKGIKIRERVNEIDYIKKVLVQEKFSEKNILQFSKNQKN